MIDEVSRGLDHAPSATDGTEATTFAGKGLKVPVTAAVALHLQEAEKRVNRMRVDPPKIIRRLPPAMGS